MALKRGLAALKETKAEQDRSGGGGGQSRQLFVSDGDTVLMRFFGDFENEQDPIIAREHYIKRLAKGSQYQNCAENNPEGHAGCVPCYLRTSGDKGISLSQRAYFRVLDMRKYHKLDAEVQVLKPGVVAKPGVAPPPGSFVMTKYPRCKGLGCQFCKQGMQAQLEGFKYWVLSVTYAEQLVTQANALRDFCKCGAMTEEQGGTIGVQQYLCGQCSQPVDYAPERGAVAKCLQCKQVATPLEEIACTACDNPQRATLQDFLFRVRRTGSGTDTTYNFEAVYPCKPPSEELLKEAAEKAPDFEKILAPLPAEMQAQLLSVPSPFAPTPGHGSMSYETPAPAQRPVAAPQTRTAAPFQPPKPAAAPPKAGGFRLPKRPAQPVVTAPAFEEEEIPY